MRFIGPFLAVLTGIPILRYAYATTWRPGLDTPEWLFFAGILLITLHGVIAVHELGHLAGGRMVGFRFRLLVIGLLRITRADGRTRIGLNRDLLKYAGVAGSSPDDPAGMRRRMAIVLLAGPVMSLLAGAVALALLVAGLPDAWTRDWFVEFTATRALALFAAGSLAVGIITLLPGGSPGRPTDGSRMLELARGGPAAERTVALLSLNSLALAGRSPHEWPDSLLRSALEPVDGSEHERKARLLAIEAATERGDTLRVEEHRLRLRDMAERN